MMLWPLSVLAESVVPGRGAGLGFGVYVSGTDSWVPDEFFAYVLVISVCSLLQCGVIYALPQLWQRLRTYARKKHLATLRG